MSEYAPGGSGGLVIVCRCPYDNKHKLSTGAKNNSVFERYIQGTDGGWGNCIYFPYDNKMCKGFEALNPNRVIHALCIFHFLYD